MDEKSIIWLVFHHNSSYKDGGGGKGGMYMYKLNMWWGYIYMYINATASMRMQVVSYTNMNTVVPL